MAESVIACTLVALLVFATPAHALAQGSDTQRRVAIASAMEKAGGYGKVLSVKPYRNKEGIPGFRIRVLTDGRVRTFDIAAEPGR